MDTFIECVLLFCIKTLKLLTTLKSELGSKRLQSRGLLNPVVNLDRVYYRKE